MKIIDRREFVIQLAAGVAGFIITTGVGSTFANHSFGRIQQEQIQRPWEWDEAEYKMRVVTVGVGPLGTKMVRILSRNRPDMECYAIPCADAMNQVLSLLDAGWGFEVLNILFDSDELASFPLVQTIAQLGIDYNALTIGIANWSQGATPIVRHWQDSLEPFFNTLIPVSAASFSGATQFMNQEICRQGLNGLAMRHVVTIINDIFLYRFPFFGIDYNDIRQVLSNARWISVGEANGTTKAARLAMKQLKGQVGSLKKVAGVLVCIQYGTDTLPCWEFWDESGEFFSESFHESADILVGQIKYEGFGQDIRVTLVAMA